MAGIGRRLQRQRKKLKRLTTGKKMDQNGVQLIEGGRRERNN